MTVHNLKTDLPPFQALWAGLKTFEIRWDDRGYQVGDRLMLWEWEGEEQTGRAVTAIVAHVQPGGQYGISEGWVVLSLRYLNRCAPTDTGTPPDPSFGIGYRGTSPAPPR